MGTVPIHQLKRQLAIYINFQAVVVLVVNILLLKQMHVSHRLDFMDTGLMKWILKILILTIFIVDINLK